MNEVNEVFSRIPISMDIEDVKKRLPLALMRFAFGKSQPNKDSLVKDEARKKVRFTLSDDSLNHLMTAKKDHNLGINDTVILALNEIINNHTVYGVNINEVHETA